ncbi:hypothetical protein caldi_30290 [Caldinitratiruptor microaerophilus]|uniref:MurNAc-LAA domain-containing protein n=1 Tax=Caldinitratiruptor microaerophilus TaxID=671077 RepID=A0AA35GB31_9FIRM|nr:hypothetical protein caldi_30290 [Caldinitratiruptor microaerophilus]
MTVPLVCIDPGHGGLDPGASGNGLVEKEVVLDLALRIRDHLLAQYDVQVMMTRETDIYVSLADRCRLANEAGADYFHSVHCNAFDDPAAEGYEDYIHTSLSDTSRTAQIRDAVHAEIMGFLAPYGVQDRGKKKADFYVLRRTVMSAVLTENLFLTNAQDAALPRQSEFRDQLAAAHARGIARALGLQPKSGGTGTPILGPAQVSTEQARTWARKRGATAEFVGLADLYWRLAPERGGVRPEVAFSQAAKETGFGHFGGTVKPGWHNPAGLKTFRGGADDDPAAYQKFPSWEAGVTAHLDHLALYAGAPGYPRKDTPDERHLPSRFGVTRTVEGLGGRDRWAPTPDYGVSIVRDYLASLMVTQAEPEDEVVRLREQVEELKAALARSEVARMAAEEAARLCRERLRQIVDLARESV